MLKPLAVLNPVLLLAAVVIAACSGGGGSSSREGLVMDKQARKAVPLTKAYDPPVDPPQVELQSWRDRPPEVIQHGVRYAGEWIVAGKLERAPEPRPIPWPAPADLDDDSGSLFVSFGPVPTPDFIEVRVYGEAVDADGTPTTEQPIATVECARSDPAGSDCIENRGGTVGVSLRIPQGGVRHITVWASWHVPTRLRERLGVESSDVYSAWLFKTRG